MMPYQTDWQPAACAEVPCHKCGVAGQIEFREWESSCGGYEDLRYRCNSCGEHWWVEGADA